MSIALRVIAVLCKAAIVIAMVGWVILLMGLLGSAIIGIPGREGVLYLALFIATLIATPWFYRSMRYIYHAT